MNLEFSRNPKQGQFIGSLRHHTAFVGGIGSGKTYSGSVKALLAGSGFIGNPHGKHIKIPTPNLGIVTAPTYKMLKTATARTFLEVAGDAVTQFHKSDMRATLANGSEIYFMSTENPETLRGPSILWWWGDEAALYTPDVWKIMIGRMRQYGMFGYDWLTTTPKGRNWIWQRFIRDANVDYRIIKAKTSENAYVDRQLIKALEEDYQGDFALQELEGEFVAFEGLIYPEFSRRHNVFSEPPKDFKYVVAGVDWGFSNPGVILVCGVDTDDRMWLIDEHYQRQRRIEEWADVARQIRELHNVNIFVCDPSEPDYIEAFNQRDCYAIGANNTVSTGLQNVKARLVVQGDGLPRLLISSGAVNTISEFEQYQWAENKYGIKDEPLKTNDHTMDALRYAVMHMDYNDKIQITGFDTKDPYGTSSWT